MPDALTSWKEIASYLGVTVRTAQKWEHERGLPVRHLPGPRRGRVETTIAELLAWRQTPDTAAPEPQSPLTRRWLAPAVVLLVLTGITAVAFVLRPVRPASYRIEQSTIIITDQDNREVWRKVFPSLSIPTEVDHQLVWIGDLDGNGTTTVLMNVIAAHPGEREGLIAYNSNGRELWRYAPGHAVHTRTESFDARYHVQAFLVAPLGREHQRRIAVASSHDVSFPGQVVLLDDHGRVLREYWHSGHLNHLAVADLHGEGWNDLIAAGINNDYGSTTLIALDPDAFTGASVERAAHQLLDFPAPAEDARILFPRSCINRKLEPFTTVTNLATNDHGISLEVQHRLNPPDATIFYELSPTLEVRHVTIGSSFERAHLSLHAQHVIDHDFNAIEEKALEHVTYLGAIRQARADHAGRVPAIP